MVGFEVGLGLGLCVWILYVMFECKWKVVWSVVQYSGAFNFKKVFVFICLRYIILLVRYTSAACYVKWHVKRRNLVLHKDCFSADNLAMFEFCLNLSDFNMQVVSDLTWKNVARPSTEYNFWVANFGFVQLRQDKKLS